MIVKKVSPRQDYFYITFTDSMFRSIIPKSILLLKTLLTSYFYLYLLCDDSNALSLSPFTFALFNDYYDYTSGNNSK